MNYEISTHNLAQENELSAADQTAVIHLETSKSAMLDYISSLETVTPRELVIITTNDAQTPVIDHIKGYVFDEQIIKKNVHQTRKGVKASYLSLNVFTSEGDLYSIIGLTRTDRLDDAAKVENRSNVFYVVDSELGDSYKKYDQSNAEDINFQQYMLASLRLELEGQRVVSYF